MNVTLTRELSDYVESHVQMGKYNSESEVISDALDNKIRQTMEIKLDNRIQEAKQQIKDGETVSIDDYFDKKIAIIKNNIGRNS